MRGLLALAQLSCYAFAGWTAGYLIGKTARGIIDGAVALERAGDELHSLHIALDDQVAIARALIARGPIIPYPAAEPPHDLDG